MVSEWHYLKEMTSCAVEPVSFSKVFNYCENNLYALILIVVKQTAPTINRWGVQWEQHRTNEQREEKEIEGRRYSEV